MMSDKEILILSISKYAKGLASDLFHINSLASQAVINYVIKNMEDKYGQWIDLFIDKNDNINIDLLGNAFKEELKNRSESGLVVNIFGRAVVFNDKDVDELINIFKEFKKN